MKSQTTARQISDPTLLTPAQLESRRNQQLVIDVRGWIEYLMGHVPGAQRLSRNHILRNIPKDQAIALTCLSGHRSAMEAQWLVTQGYHQVYNLQGGLLAWQGKGYPIRRGNRP
jgi:thiosulfate sulfurtransferase